MTYKTSIILVFIGMFALAGCQSAYQSPVADIDEPRFLDSDRIHRVNEGETLYAIAWIYDLDFMHIARVNNLVSPYNVIPGQILNVDPRAETSSGVQNQVQIQARSTPTTSTAENTTQSRQNRPAQVNPVVVGQRALIWGWPAQGNIVGEFSEVGVENKGVNIAGQKGDPVMAAADGEVVYSGSGLLRYGDLLIIKHNDRFLTAYAHNNALLVSEGDKVSRGQRIAELGSTGVDRDMLHFEIRLEGKPVNPINYLPPRS